MIYDPYFQVKVLSATATPQTLIYQAMHQDYSEEFVGEHEPELTESECGRIIVTRLLSSDRGHYGPLEHPQITFACGYFPHSVMQQARTHRVSISFDVQSMRYTGMRLVQASAMDDETLERTFYLRPPGHYRDRHGSHFNYTETIRQKDLEELRTAAKGYARRVSQGMPEEQARGMVPFDFRQHFVVSFNLRSALHFLDLRAKADAQIEIQALCNLMIPHLNAWCPDVVGWYIQSRYKKAKLSP